MPLPSALLASGNFAPDQIKLAVSAEPLPDLPDQIQAQVDREWTDLLAQAERDGFQVWDSPCYFLRDCREAGGELRLALGLVDYRRVQGLTALIDKGLLDGECASRQMYSSLAIRTADGRYLFGRGAKRVYVGGLKFVGGVYSQAECVLRDGPSLFQGALNELAEELNIATDQVGSLSLRRVYATPRGLRDFYFEAMLRISAEEAARRFAGRQDQELSELLVLSPQEAREAVAGLADWRREKVELIGAYYKKAAREGGGD